MLINWKDINWNNVDLNIILCMIYLPPMKGNKLKTYYLLASWDSFIRVITNFDQ